MKKARSLMTVIAVVLAAMFLFSGCKVSFVSMNEDQKHSYESVIKQLNAQNALLDEELASFSEPSDLMASVYNSTSFVWEDFYTENLTYGFIHQGWPTKIQGVSTFDEIYPETRTLVIKDEAQLKNTYRLFKHKPDFTKETVITYAFSTAYYVTSICEYRILSFDLKDKTAYVELEMVVLNEDGSGETPEFKRVDQCFLTVIVNSTEVENAVISVVR